MQITRFLGEDQTLKRSSLFRRGIFRPNLGEDHKRKKSFPPILCVIFRSILSDNKRNKQEVFATL